MNEAYSLAPFNPTCDQAQQIAIDILGLQSKDVLFDLGCGDARLLIRALQQVPGLQCVGIDMDEKLVGRANENIEKLPVEDQRRIQVRKQNLVLELDESSIGTSSRPSFLHDATAIYLYLLPKGLAQILPILNRVADQRKSEQKRLRIVSYMFQLRGWDPVQVNDTTKGQVKIYLYECGAPP